MRKPKIFISHISKETEFAQLLKNQLLKGFLDFPEIFVSSDGKSIPPGSNWLYELGKALEGAEIEIILFSKESIGKSWINFEAGAGWVKGIEIIPLCHSGVRPGDLPIPFNLLQGLEINQPKDLRLLFETISKKIGMTLPQVDFNAMALEIKEIENKYKQAEWIDNPKILCAASHQYSQLDFELDIKILEKTFPNSVTVEKQLTSKRLRELLTIQHFDIIHLVLAVNNNNGDLLFSDVDENYNPLGNKIDKMSAEGFARFVVEGNTSLIVLATCHALSLAVEIANITNMIATNSVISGKLLEDWSDCFYDLIAKGYPLYKAFEITRDNISSVPLRLIRNKNVVYYKQEF